VGITLRKHQRETVEVCREILEGEPIREIVLSICPGGGKSIVPVILAENLIPTKADKLCWVVPRNSLKYQGEDEFCNPYWRTKKRIRSADNGEDLSRGLSGYVTTYQAVGIDPGCHERELRKHKYILYLDEFHHIAEGSQWHEAIKPLVDSAAIVVFASGTLSRGDGSRIAFLGYVHGEPFLGNLTTRRVIQYSRNEAIGDRAIMPIQFELVDGEAEWEEMDGHKNSSALSGEESEKAFFTALRTEYADHLLEAALRELAEISRNYHEAKLLVVAPDIDIAKAYYDYLALHGHRVRIATSEDTPQARRNIQDYKRGVYHILVTVAMAYEGLNVPEISVICCLTHIRSVPWLEQCFARANRIAFMKEKAVVYAPADWAFKKAVRMIEREQLVPLSDPDDQQELIQGDNGLEGSGNLRPWIIPLSSKANLDGRIDHLISNEHPPCSPSDAERILRKNINGVITAFLDKQAHGSLLAHSKMLYRRLRLICDKPVKDMNQSELEKVWLWIRREYGDQQDRRESNS
jgi:superfamily II DNA or RNA helicase